MSTTSRKTGGVSRRDFLRNAGVAGLGTIALASGLRAGDAQAAKGKNKADALPTRPLGKTGLDLPVLALGASIDFTQNQLILKQALKRGIYHWDTSSVYSNGLSEKGLGMFFSKYPKKRKDVFLVTKSWRVNDVEGLEKDLNKSMEKMKTDYIDLYFFHGIDSLEAVDTDRMKTWVEKQKKAGKIKFIGFSTHKKMAPLMARAAKMGWLDAIMISYNYRLMAEDDMQRGLDSCFKTGIGMIAMKTQGGGPITDTKEDRKLAGHFVKKGYTPQQAKVKAILANEQITCVCSHLDTIETMESNIAAVLDKPSLDKADLKALDHHARATCATYCSGCGKCDRAMSGEVPVSRIMRYLMYSRNYSEHAHARERFLHFPARVRARVASGDFARAERACPQGLPVTRLLREAAVEFA